MITIYIFFSSSKALFIVRVLGIFGEIKGTREPKKAFAETTRKMLKWALVDRLYLLGELSRTQPEIYVWMYLFLTFWLKSNLNEIILTTDRYAAIMWVSYYFFQSQWNIDIKLSYIKNWVFCLDNYKSMAISALYTALINPILTFPG